MKRRRRTTPRVGNNNLARARGRRAEQRVKKEYERRGWTMKRGGSASDFIASRGRRRVRVEVKTGSAKLTARQREARARAGPGNYRVEFRATRRARGERYAPDGARRRGRATRTTGRKVTRKGQGSYTIV